MQNAISTLNILPTTKDERKVFVDMYINELQNGYTEPKIEALKLKAYKSFIEEIESRKEFKELVRKEVEKENKGIYSTELGKIELVEVGTKYDFSSTNDSELFDMYEKMETLKENIKARETFLKTIKSEAYGSDGVQLFAPIKSSTSSIKITLK